MKNLNSYNSEKQTSEKGQFWKTNKTRNKKRTGNEKSEEKKTFWKERFEKK